MARYLGPLWKKSRSLQFPFLEGKEFSRGKKRSIVPGMHQDKKRKHSIYALQNIAKQTFRLLYGVREKQLFNEFKKVRNSWQALNLGQENIGDIGDKLLINFESRLDNIVFRANFAPTRRCARQFVSHGHFLVEGSRVKSPAYKTKVGQVISFSNSLLANNKIIQESLNRNLPNPSYISVDRKKMTITCLRRPSLNEDQQIRELKNKINIPLLIEWYNRKV